MALAFASSLHVVTGMRTLCKTNSISSNLNATSKLSGRRKFSSSANVTFDRTKVCLPSSLLCLHNQCITYCCLSY